MASKCTITFDNNPYGVYYAGQMVSGTAELITTRPKTIRSIYISISGFAEVRWTENVTKQDTHGKPTQAIETFSASEVYYSFENYVYGQSGGLQLELPAGKYVYPFQAQIPPNAPTSLNSGYGQIKHEVSLVIDRVMRYNNDFKQPYTVISPYDLNLNPENAKPFQKIDEKTFCWSFCCGAQGPMIMTVKVPFSGYAPGQKIRFNIIMDNQSDINCSDVKVRLMKKIVCTSRSPDIKTQQTEVKIADNHCGEVIKHNKAEFNEFLQIPSTTPTSLESCSIIKVNYMLKFIAKASRIFGDLVIECPITIGTVPLYASTMPDSAISTQPGAGPIYKPLPPPTFEEDVRSEQFESNTFKPRYPVFLSEFNPDKNGTNNQPALYPSPNINSPYPSLPSTTPNPIAPSAPPDSPTAVHVQMPTPVRPAVNQTSTAKTTPNPANKGSGTGIAVGLDVLGFSIPPDYEPTPAAPAAGNKPIGWK